MTRNELLQSPSFWIAKIQISLFACAKKFMNETHRNRTQLAEYLGVSKGYASQVLNGEYDHRLSKLVKLALAFGYAPKVEFVPIDQVISEDERWVTNSTTTTPVFGFIVSNNYHETAA